MNSASTNTRRIVEARRETPRWPADAYRGGRSWRGRQGRLPPLKALPIEGGNPAAIPPGNEPSDQFLRDNPRHDFRKFVQSCRADRVYRIYGSRKIHFRYSSTPARWADSAPTVWPSSRKAGKRCDFCQTRSDLPSPDRLDRLPPRPRFASLCRDQRTGFDWLSLAVLQASLLWPVCESVQYVAVLRSCGECVHHDCRQPDFGVPCAARG